MKNAFRVLSSALKVQICINVILVPAVGHNHIRDHYILNLSFVLCSLFVETLSRLVLLQQKLCLLLQL
jgi:hypothetical protein